MNGTLAALRADIPATVLSDEAVQALRTLHDAGGEVNAYTRASLTEHLDGQPERWVIWVRPAHGWQEGRFSPAEWEAFYRHWLAAADAQGRLTLDYWLFVCRMLGETQPNGQLVPQAPREVEIVTEAPTVAEGKVSA